ncbi:unnamed protein product [Protopolystoma xenopodis]|uniref:Uncharacterized protein n=1 Tax=Protopolystoma xenopodis TaxID=117903 RepID=A0A448WPB9_9PLAT|nr:unnamed protein product [Protopolystoma xenopodis]
MDSSYRSHAPPSRLAAPGLGRNRDSPLACTHPARLATFPTDSEPVEKIHFFIVPNFPNVLSSALPPRPPAQLRYPRNPVAPRSESRGSQSLNSRHGQVCQGSLIALASSGREDPRSVGLTCADRLSHVFRSCSPPAASRRPREAQFPRQTVHIVCVRRLGENAHHPIRHPKACLA